MLKKGFQLFLILVVGFVIGYLAAVSNLSIGLSVLASKVYTNEARHLEKDYHPREPVDVQRRALIRFLDMYLMLNQDIRQLLGNESLDLDYALTTGRLSSTYMKLGNDEEAKEYGSKSIAAFSTLGKSFSSVSELIDYVDSVDQKRWSNQVHEI